MKAQRWRPKEPDFVTKTELAMHLGIDTSTVDEWIRKNILPPPHSRPGERHAIWLRKHYHAFRDTQAWPPEAWPKSVRSSEPSM